MEGDFSQRTPQLGHVMFPNRHMEVPDARHEEGAEPEGQPPSAAGDRPTEGDPDPGLIAHTKRPSFLQLLSALLGAEEDLERRRGNEDLESPRPQHDDHNQKEES